MAARAVFCKPYHRPGSPEDLGFLDRSGHRKSRCPGWVLPFRDALLADALPDPDGAVDSFGHPKRVWNAVDGWYFVGVSTNQKVPTYNCYPEEPATELVAQLVVRAQRQVSALPMAPK